jgi:hypothetical protein
MDDQRAIVTDTTVLAQWLSFFPPNKRSLYLPELNADRLIRRPKAPSPSLGRTPEVFVTTLPLSSTISIAYSENSVRFADEQP